MRSALQLSGQARNALFVPGSAGQTAQIVTFIFALWQASVSAMAYISGFDLRGGHRRWLNRVSAAAPGCQVKAG